MVLEQYANILGILAGSFGTVMSLAYLPQAYKIWRRKSVEDLSITMFSILTLGMFIWMLYGLSLNNLPLIIPNIVGVIAGCIIIGLYFKYKK